MAARASRVAEPAEDRAPNELSIGVGAANWMTDAVADDVRQFARITDDGGLDFVAFIDHVVMPWPTADGTPRSRYAADTEIIEAIVTMGFVAAATRHVCLRTAVLVLPQRHPAVVAKQLAAVDLLSGCRLDVGVGVGWLGAEFDALGVPFAERGRRTDEALDVMRQLWTLGSASVEGTFYRLDAMAMEPKPLQRPHPPLWFGGTTAPAFRRVVRLGVGWIAPVAAGVDQVRNAVSGLERAATEAGRDPAELKVQAALKVGEETKNERILDRAAEIVAAGATDLMFVSGDPPGGPFGVQEQALRRVCDEVAPVLRREFSGPALDLVDGPWQA